MLAGRDAANPNSAQLSFLPIQGVQGEESVWFGSVCVKQKPNGRISPPLHAIVKCFHPLSLLHFVIARLL